MATYFYNFQWRNGQRYLFILLTFADEEVVPSLSESQKRNSLGLSEFPPGSCRNKHCLLLFLQSALHKRNEWEDLAHSSLKMETALQVANKCGLMCTFVPWHRINSNCHFKRSQNFPLESSFIIIFKHCENIGIQKN